MAHWLELWWLIVWSSGGFLVGIVVAHFLELPGSSLVGVIVDK